MGINDRRRNYRGSDVKMFVGGREVVHQNGGFMGEIYPHAEMVRNYNVVQSRLHQRLGQFVDQKVTEELRLKILAETTDCISELFHEGLINAEFVEYWRWWNGKA